MKQKLRKTLVLISLLLFPVTLNFFSPYVSIDGAMSGIISGSLLLFFIMLFTGLFFGRAWCGWVCPMSALCDYAMHVSPRPASVKKLKVIRYSIFALWAGVLVAMFVLAGGIKGIDPLHLTENIVSVDMPIKYVIYYFVLALFVVLTLVLGRRGACHAVCWMSPFLTAGYTLGRLLRIPQLRIKADTQKCLGCGACTANCPMSIKINEGQSCFIKTSDCILCGQCVQGCQSGALRYGITGKTKAVSGEQTISIK